MRIDAGRIGADKVAREYAERVSQPKRDATPKSDRTVGAASEQPVSISPEAKLLSKAKAAFEAQPETRESLVQDIKGRVDSGNYKVDSGDLASRMLERLGRG